MVSRLWYRGYGTEFTVPRLRYRVYGYGIQVMVSRLRRTVLSLWYRGYGSIEFTVMVSRLWYRGYGTEFMVSTLRYRGLYNNNK